MVKHIVFFKLKPETTAAERQRFIDELWSIPQNVVWVRNWDVKLSLPDRPVRFYDLALMGDFEDVAAVDRYIDSRPHQHLLDTINSVCASRAAFNYEI